MRTFPIFSSLILTSFVSCVVSGCRSGGTPPPEVTTAHEVCAPVRTLMDSIAHDISARGPAAWLRYFDSTGHFSMVNQGRLTFPDLDSAAAGVHQFAAGIRQITLTWSDIRIDSLTPRFAAAGAAFREEMTDTKGHPMEFAGYFTAVAEATPSGWRLRNAHWSMADNRK